MGEERALSGWSGLKRVLRLQNPGSGGLSDMLRRLDAQKTRCFVQRCR